MTTNLRESPALSDVPDDEPATSAAPTDAPPARRPLLLAQAGAVLVAIGLLVWAVVSYASASSGSDDTRDAIRARDALQVEATHAIEVLNTLDRRHVDEGLQAWASVSAGDLRQQLTDLSAKKRRALGKVAQISSAKVAAIAVTRIDDKGGTAAVIAFVEKSVGDTPAQVRAAKPSRIQFSADLVRQGGTWLVSDLTPVAVVTPEGKEAS